ncbi:hypothetical protein B0H19DRAFT_1224493 [Mycena capillaripes]|nr:hypothetical protein B0H19DRAFT_1224493 [Mycena capillaripes]
MKLGSGGRKKLVLGLQRWNHPILMLPLRWRWFTSFSAGQFSRSTLKNRLETAIDLLYGWTGAKGSAGAYPPTLFWMERDKDRKQPAAAIRYAIHANKRVACLRNSPSLKAWYSEEPIWGLVLTLLIGFGHGFDSTGTRGQRRGYLLPYGAPSILMGSYDPISPSPTVAPPMQPSTKLFEGGYAVFSDNVPNFYLEEYDMGLGLFEAGAEPLRFSSKIFGHSMGWAKEVKDGQARSEGWGGMAQSSLVDVQTFGVYVLCVMTLCIMSQSTVPQIQPGIWLWIAKKSGEEAGLVQWQTGYLKKPTPPPSLKIDPDQIQVLPWVAKPKGSAMIFDLGSIIVKKREELAETIFVFCDSKYDTNFIAVQSKQPEKPYARGVDKDRCRCRRNEFSARRQKFGSVVQNTGCTGEVEKGVHWRRGHGGLLKSLIARMVVVRV